MGETISDRARALFNEARVKTLSGAQQVMAEHASKGLLNSGATVKRIVETHGTMTRHALGEATASIGRRVESRGFRWKRMISDVRRELDAYLADAEQTLNRELQKAVPNGPKLTEPLLISVRERLYRDLDDYREGWTGTPGRPWSERHKVLYTILVALIGAALTVVTGIASRLMEASLNIGN